MAGQILFFKKSRCDFSIESVVASASQGSAYAAFALNRNNTSAWITSGSVDADNTTFDVDLGEMKDISQILLLKHNFKAFTVKYWDGATYQAFSPSISETTNTAASNRYTVTAQSTSKLRIQITGTQVVNADKYLYQFIATELVGQLEGWPVITNPEHNRNKIASMMLSGKLNVSVNVGGFRCDLKVDNWKSSADLTIVEALYNSNEGFLVWLCGGDETQFASVRQGYRYEDLFLMRTTDNYRPEYVRGLYKSGFAIDIKLAEVIE